MNILWIMNKYIKDSEDCPYFPYFCNFLKNFLKTEDINLRYIFFSNNYSAKLRPDDSFNFNSELIAECSADQIDNEAKRLEKDYSITFKQALYPDLLQVTGERNERKIHLSENFFSNIDFHIKKILYLEKVIIENNIDVVFCDQSPEAEMEFGRAICLKLNKIFLRQTSCFLGRSTIHQQFEFGKERLAEPEWHKKFSLKDAKQLVKEYVKLRKPPYPKVDTCVPNRKIAYRLNRRGIKRTIKYIPKFLINKSLNLIHNVYLSVEEKVGKRIIQDQYNPNVPYLFLGFHLTNESTVTLRSMPYTNQVFLADCISRVLPHRYSLYVREHPTWRKRFSLDFLAYLKRLPNVRLIPANVSIHEILKNAKGIVTFNSTTGIEALMYGKPVLSFAPNVYYKHHPAVSYCSDLYELGPKLIKLINTPVNIEDTYQYIIKMMNHSNEVLLGANLFLSEEDSKFKAEKFSKYLKIAIEWCKMNNRS